MRTCLLLPVLLLLPTPTSAADPSGVEFFETKVRPVLADNCFGCHSTKAVKLKGGLRLDSRAGIIQGGDTGPAIMPGDPSKSRLITAIGYKDVDLQMPPKGKLSDAAIADLAAWVKMGAPWGGETLAGASGSKTAFDLAKRKAEHWAWRPIRVTPLPDVRNQDWSQTPVDRFVLAKLQAANLHPASPADRETLLRRVTFDFTGLPPTIAEQDAFLADTSPEAFAHVVDRLLASPAFGERWGRHWLDLVRYAEGRGHEFDYPVPNAHQYRDYVIRAINADVPYDRLTMEHIAGDLLLDPRRHPADGSDESILGTGFWLLGEMVHSPVDLRQDQADHVDNMIDVASKAFLGLTVACARCHDHKFDAIGTRDYYALMGVLEGSSGRLVRFDGRQQNRRVAEQLAELRQARGPAVRAALASVLRPRTDRLADTLRAAAAVRAGIHPDAAASNFQVDVGAVNAWLAELKLAAKDERHPFHAWAVLADAKDFAARRAELLAAERRRAAAVAHALDGTQVIVDFAHPRPDEWLPDDVTFGPGPVRAGDLLFGSDVTRPVRGVATLAAARFDPLWAGVADAPGSESESGDLAYPRAGRTFRSRSFVVERPKLYSLVRGTGRAFACVDGHIMMEGPLHRTLVKKVASADGWMWLEHDLSRYRGERVHLEFTAGKDGDFAVVLVVQADKPPAPVDGPGLRSLALLDTETPDALADAYQKLAADAVKALADGTLDKDADLARVVDLLLRRFSPSPETGEGANSIRRFADDQREIISHARLVSRVAPALWDANGVDEHVFVRGSPKTPGEVVPHRFLEALTGPGPLIGSGSGRLELARLITDPERNPFLARVTVNRVWHHLFGRGLVASVDNFGVLGEPPTHPELLDWLADDFVRRGWSLKSLIRSLVLTRAYQMSSRPDPAGMAVDPQNRLLHRANVRRLEGEAIRDALLAAAGGLDRTMFGPPVPIHLTPFMDGRGRPKDDGPLDGAGRRSVYLAVRRNFPDPFLTVFDLPPPATTAGQRTVSNVPAQALVLMNDPFVHQQAEAWGRRVLGKSGPAEERVAGMIRQAFGRRATAEEVRECLEFVTAQRESYGTGADDPRPWADLAHALVNAKEFVFVH
jgi:hypothetical protein